MEQFELTKEGLKHRSRSEERSVIFSVLSVGTLFSVCLFMVLYWLNGFRWFHIIIGVACVWTLVELFAARTRRHVIEKFQDFKVEYKNSIIVEIRDAEKTIEVQRNEIQYVCEFSDGLEVGDLSNAIFIPKEIDGYAELIDELSKWRPIETLNTNQSFEPIMQVIIDVFRFIGTFLATILSASNFKSQLFKTEKPSNSVSRRRSLREKRMQAQRNKSRSMK